jgi:hypothetical protein
MTAKHVEYRDFPVNREMTKFVKIPVNRRGEPIRTSREWKTMIANAIAKSPEDRSPAERTAVRRELSEG